MADKILNIEYSEISANTSTNNINTEITNSDVASSNTNIIPTEAEYLSDTISAEYVVPSISPSTSFSSVSAENLSQSLESSLEYSQISTSNTASSLNTISTIIPTIAGIPNVNISAQHTPSSVAPSLFFNNVSAESVPQRLSISITGIDVNFIPVVGLYKRANSSVGSISTIERDFVLNRYLESYYSTISSNIHLYTQVQKNAAVYTNSLILEKAAGLVYQSYTSNSSNIYKQPTLGINNVYSTSLNHLLEINVGKSSLTSANSLLVLLSLDINRYYSSNYSVISSSISSLLNKLLINDIATSTTIETIVNKSIYSNYNILSYIVKNISKYSLNSDATVSSIISYIAIIPERSVVSTFTVGSAITKVSNITTSASLSIFSNYLLNIDIVNTDIFNIEDSQLKVLSVAKNTYNSTYDVSIQDVNKLIDTAINNLSINTYSLSTKKSSHAQSSDLVVGASQNYFISSDYLEDPTYVGNVYILS